MRTRTNSSKHSPCVCTTFDASGQVVAIRTEAPDVARRSYDYEAETVTYTYVVIAEQETGEDHHVGYAKDYAHGTFLGDNHLDTHQEHRSYRIESL